MPIIKNECKSICINDNDIKSVMENLEKNITETETGEKNDI